MKIVNIVLKNIEKATLDLVFSGKLCSLLQYRDLKGID